MKRSRPSYAATVALACLVAVACVIPPAAAVERIPKPGKIKPPTKAWVAKVKDLAPARPTVAPKAPRKVLVFSVATGYQHAVIPHADVVVKVLAEKTGAFTATFTTDVTMFAPEKIKAFDAVILNNTCSNRPTRDLFLDIVTGNGKGLTKKLSEKFKDLSAAEKKALAASLEKSLLDFVAAGGGLVGIHGAITTFNTSAAFERALGGNFTYHPKAQEFALTPAEPDHPLLKAFGGEAFIHTDEPYMMAGPTYKAVGFRPLLTVDGTKIKGARKGTPRVLYAAWVKKHGKGRVFYVAPGHFPETYRSMTASNTPWAT